MKNFTIQEKNERESDKIVKSYKASTVLEPGRFQAHLKSSIESYMSTIFLFKILVPALDCISIQKLLIIFQL